MKIKDTMGYVYYSNGKREAIQEYRYRYDPYEDNEVVAIRTNDGNVFKYKRSKNTAFDSISQVGVGIFGIEYYPVEGIDRIILCEDDPEKYLSYMNRKKGKRYARKKKIG